MKYCITLLMQTSSQRKLFSLPFIREHSPFTCLYTPCIPQHFPLHIPQLSQFCCLSGKKEIEAKGNCIARKGETGRKKGRFTVSKASDRKGFTKGGPSSIRRGYITQRGLANRCVIFSGLLLLHSTTTTTITNRAILSKSNLATT